MTLYFEKAGTKETIQFSIPENQNFYSVLLPNGKYYAYAWAPGYNLEGAYTDSSGLMKTFVVSRRANHSQYQSVQLEPLPTRTWTVTDKAGRP